MMTDSILAHLQALVNCDTQNPPRHIDATHPIFAYIEAKLEAAGDFSVSVKDHGKGRVSYFAERGNPQILFNVHLDTVPAGTGWSRSALQIAVEQDRAFGRGTCDIKGAAAVLLAIAVSSDVPMAFLFTTDEEGAEGCCVAEFCRRLDKEKYSFIVVAEPTGCKAVIEHRGYLSVLGEFHSVAGHSSDPRALRDNTNHQAACWAGAAIAYAADAAARGEDLCFNIGAMSGGSSSNVITAKTNVHWSARLPPGGQTESALSAICGATRDAEQANWNARFTGPPMPASAELRDVAEKFCAEHKLDVGPAVDYWTEASLFSRAGYPAIVLGPGNIEQAHIPDEWVSIDQLALAGDIYQRLLEETGNE